MALELEPRPTEEYLCGCSKPGSHSSSKADKKGKKLLVLDLNGTLVHRLPNLPSPGGTTTVASSTTASSSSSHTHLPDTLSTTYLATPSSPASLLPTPPTATPTTAASPSPSAAETPPSGVEALPGIPISSRTSYPRPYIPTLLAYLFHPDTKSWLTTIAWSSSKPSSVHEMVQRCFGEHGTRELGAVWCRDGGHAPVPEHEPDLGPETLNGGGGEEHKEKHKNVKKKKKAVKDLRRIWEPSPSIPWPTSLYSPSTSAFASSSVTSTPPPAGLPRWPPRELQGFSQLDTILLDDTPSKAIYQPHNYIPIEKYTRDRLLADYASCGIEVGEYGEDDGGGTAGAGKRKMGGKAGGDDVDVDVDVDADLSTDSPTPTEPASPASLTRGLEDARDPVDDGVSPAGATSVLSTSGSRLPIPPSVAVVGGDDLGDLPDPSLLAIIGILDALRGVGDVSWWIKNGGLIRRGRSSCLCRSTGANGQEESENPLRMWYMLPELGRYWAQRGKEVAKAMGIEVVAYETTRAGNPIAGPEKEVRGMQGHEDGDEGEVKVKVEVVDNSREVESTPSPVRPELYGDGHVRRPTPLQRVPSSSSSAVTMNTIMIPVG